MPLYTAKFSRQVVSRDEYEEVIEAASPEEAQAKADALADGFNDSCPDGVIEAGVECRDWGVVDVQDAPEGAVATE